MNRVSSGVSRVLRSCDCIKYETMLISEGFDRVDSLARMDNDDMVAMGIPQKEGDKIREAARNYINRGGRK